MHYKIIETEIGIPDVLIHRDRDEKGEYVRIFAIGLMEGRDNMFAIERVDFENYTTALRFIKDFSWQSAEEWCIKQGIDYWV
jgi:hypothetical protein